MFNGFHVWIFQRIIHVLFQWDSASGANAFVGGDHQA